MFVMGLIIVLFVFCWDFMFVIGFQKNLSPKDSLKEDMFLDSLQFLEKYGYKTEKFKLTTEDGYILEIHHMLPKQKIETPRNHPVFLMHGLGSSSFDWISLGPGRTLPHILHDEGFDVWLGNARGTIYSRDHISMNVQNPDFWKFSWHEIGFYDLATFIDFVLEKTSSSKLHYIGHSQGCTTFFVLTSSRPEYNKKIQTMNALAPPIFMEQSQFLLALPASIENIIKSHVINKTLGILELPSFPVILRGPTYYLCREESSFKSICENLIFTFSGHNKDLLNSTHLPLALSHVPAGGSAMQLLHYAQLIKRGRFARYDHGKIENQKLYDAETPPDYPLENVTAPIAIHYGDNDLMVSVPGVKKLRTVLSNVILFRRVPHPDFNHIDFLFAINVTYYLHNSVVSVIKKHDII